MTLRASDIYFAISALFAALCLLISPFWTYLGNVVVGVPCFVLSWVFWSLSRRAEPQARRLVIVQRLWLVSAGVAAVSLVAFLVTN